MAASRVDAHAVTDATCGASVIVLAPHAEIDNAAMSTSGNRFIGRERKRRYDSRTAIDRGQGMNKGGWSWKRQFGVTNAKRRVSRATGIPWTRSGRQRKVGAMFWKLFK
jgi:hypothetical protein